MKGNDFLLDDDPEWQALRRKLEGQKPSKLSRAQRKQLKQMQQQEAAAAEQRAQISQNPRPQRPLEQDYRTTRPYPPARSTVISPMEPRTPPTSPATGAHTSEGSKKIDVSLNLTLPAFNVAKLKRQVRAGVNRITPRKLATATGNLNTTLKTKTTKKQRIIGASALAVVAVGLLSLLILNPGNNEKGITGKTDSGVLAKNTVKPDFKPVLPNGKTDDTTSGRLAYDPQHRVASFTDKIGSTDITVSEQQLPESLKPDTDTKIEKMAKDLYATDVINTSNPKAYLGTNIKGPQTLILTKNGLLIFIQSQSKIDKDQWASYITELL